MSDSNNSRFVVGLQPKSPSINAPTQPPTTCLLCYSVQMTVMDLFSPTGLEGDDTSGTNIHGRHFALVESKDDDSDSDASSSTPSINDLDSSQDSSVARKVCKLWKLRRREEKKKTQRLRQEVNISKTVTAAAAQPQPISASTATRSSSAKISLTVRQDNQPYDETDPKNHHRVRNNYVVSGGARGEENKFL